MWILCSLIHFFPLLTTSFTSFSSNYSPFRKDKSIYSTQHMTICCLNSLVLCNHFLFNLIFINATMIRSILKTQEAKLKLHFIFLFFALIVLSLGTTFDQWDMHDMEEDHTPTWFYPLLSSQVGDIINFLRWCLVSTSYMNRLPHWTFYMNTLHKYLYVFFFSILF